jgi:hypothetical protein
MWRSLSPYSSLEDSGHGAFFYSSYVKLQTIFPPWGSQNISFLQRKLQNIEVWKCLLSFVHFLLLTVGKPSKFETTCTWTPELHTSHWFIISWAEKCVFCDLGTRNDTKGTLAAWNWFWRNEFSDGQLNTFDWGYAWGECFAVTLQMN